MSNSYFKFKQFIIHQDRSAMKVTTDACLFGAWVAKEINENIQDTNDTHIRNTLLDVGTGTALLSLMIAQKNNLLIDAVEIEAKAAAQATENVKSSPWSNRINVIHNDINDFKIGKKYNYIISNPPFYENELSGEKLEKNIAHHDAGLKMSELFENIQLNLKVDGSFYILLPAKRNSEVEKMIADANLFITKKVMVKQSTLHSPFRIMIKGIHKASATIISEISITDSSKNYTPEFISLLRDYYLYL